MPARVRSQESGSTYRRNSVAEVLKSRSAMDGLKVELDGKLISGPEASLFEDASQCTESSVLRCSLWVRFDRCVVRGEKYAGMPCDQLFERFRQERSPKDRASARLVIDGVVVRGTLSTIRKDLHYDKTVPEAARVGFGHLGAYPAEIAVSEILLK